MTPRFGNMAQWFARRFFSSFQFETGDAGTLRSLESTGAIVYVMRYSSRLDYFLFNWLFLSAGLRLSSFANGIKFYYYRPLGEATRLLWSGLIERIRFGNRGMRERGILHIRRTIRRGDTAFLFLRTDKTGSRLRTRQGAVSSARSELDYLRQIVDNCFTSPDPVSLVPLALFWRKGSRPQRPFLNLFYGGPERPTDIGKVISFIWNYRNLAVRIGTRIDLQGFVSERRWEGRERIVKQVRRSLLIFLRREEKPVLGAALPTFERIQEAVLDDPEVRRTIRQIADESNRSEARVEARARRMVGEIAANQSPTMLAALSVIIAAMFKRLFARFEVHGLERVIEVAKLHPIVLLPSHRSHFDYLILSWMFYQRHLVPPQVAAGINLSFWPLGPIFRRAGGYFLRRSFDGDQLYSAVFRGYVQNLIKAGITQEFFIEGTRSRTGKTLTPRLGMLRMVLEAFSRGARRELYVIPVGFTYERLVEEGSIREERQGKAKKRESLVELLKARSVFNYSFGSVTVRFGEPISVAQRMEEAKQSGLLLPAAEGEAVPNLRPLTHELGIDISRKLNELTTAGRSSVAAAALLGSPALGIRESLFRARVSEIAQLLELLGMARSENLERCLATERPAAVIELLEQADRVKRVHSPHGDLLQIKDGVRDALDYYRATIAPALVWPAVLAFALHEARTRKNACDTASAWLDLLRLEYFPIEGPERHVKLLRLIDHFTERGWIADAEDGKMHVTRRGHEWLSFLAAQLRPIMEAYQAMLLAVRASQGKIKRRELLDSVQKVQREQLLLGEAVFPEGICSVAAGNALARLLADGVLRTDGNPNKPDADLEPGENWDLLEADAALVGAALRWP
ncbi:MAG: hypothetical protein GY725_09475 [bacterium]|nr:hypothetical protein [bacterium]